MADRYQTLAGQGESAFSIRGSEFIGHAAPAESTAAAESILETVSERYPDATHHVPAYRVQGDEYGLLREYASDDGEPSGSAGKPVANVLEGQQLENAIVVVTRYFGGTELGIGRLVRAYSRAATEAIEAAGVTETVPHEQLLLTVAYDDSGTVRQTLESAGVEFTGTYKQVVTFDVLVPTTDAEPLRDRLRSATNGRVTIE